MLSKTKQNKTDPESFTSFRRKLKLELLNAESETINVILDNCTVPNNAHVSALLYAVHLQFRSCAENKTSETSVKLQNKEIIFHS